MLTLTNSVLGAIGNTPLVQLRHVVPSGCARLVAKLEWANPTGSMKDRMAAAAVINTEARGQLKPGGTVVECTTGTTGVSLALVCATKRASGSKWCSPMPSAMRNGAPWKPSGPISRMSPVTTARSPRH